MADIRAVSGSSGSITQGSAIINSIGNGRSITVPISSDKVYAISCIANMEIRYRVGAVIYGTLYDYGSGAPDYSVVLSLDGDTLTLTNPTTVTQYVHIIEFS